jgi:hypothetical protein
MSSGITQMQEAAQKTREIIIDSMSLYLQQETDDFAGLRKSTEESDIKKSRRGADP